MPQANVKRKADLSLLIPSSQSPLSPVPKLHALLPISANHTPIPLDSEASNAPMASIEEISDTGANKHTVSKVSDFPMRNFYRSFLTPAQLVVPPRRVAVPRANCTHITMDVLHDPRMTCDICGRVSVLGWLYQCQQDNSSSAQAREELRSIAHNHAVEKMSPAEQLEAIGMSESIIDQFKKGDVYEPWQIELLKTQKLHLQKAIEKQLEKEREPWNTHTTSDSADERSRRNSQDLDLSLHPNITMRMSTRQASLSLVQKMGKLRRRSASMARCDLKCCQACRPYFKDRAFMSFNSAFANETLLLDSTEGLPIADVAIVRQIGLRRPLSRRPLFNRGSGSQETSSSGLTNSSSEGSDKSDLDLDVKLGEEVTAVPIAATSVAEDSHLDSTVYESPPTPYVMRSQTLPPGLFMSNTPHPVKAVLEHATNLSPSYSDPDMYTGARTTKNSPKSMPTRNGSQTYGPRVEGVDLPVLQATKSLSDLTPEAEEFDFELNGLNMRSLGSIDVLVTAGFHSEIVMDDRFDPARHGSVASSAYSDEIAVDGGVALMEEAVETQTPDIITHA
jgi:hypothetical protein